MPHEPERSSEPADVVRPDDAGFDVATGAFRAGERVLVTGGSGFIGTNLIDACLRSDIVALNLDGEPPRNEAQRGLWRKIDPLDNAQLQAVLSEFQPTLVFHLGARTDLHGKTLEDYVANTTGVQAIIDACNATHTIRRVIFASSRLVCPIGYLPRSDVDYCPTTLYGESKVLGEKIVRRAEHGYEWMIVRPTSIWGPWFAVPYRDFFDTVTGGRYVHIKGIAVKKSFGFVGNTVYQLERLAYATGVAERTLYLGDYPPTDVRRMANLIRAESGGSSIRSAPRWPLAVAARVGDILQRIGWAEPPLTSFRLDNLTTEMVYDLAPLEAAVGPLPFNLSEGVRMTSNWIRQHG